ncbi:MAG: hypothetical protein AB1894_13910 [Chloroflexota bacterium]
MNDLKIIGLYRIVPTMESILRAVQYYDYDWLLDEDGEYEDEIYWENHENLGLLEVQVRGAFSPDELMASISLGDQAPYMEFYLNASGSSLLSDEAINESQDCRACFFLHFVDPAKPLEVARERIALPAWSELPARLEPFAHYLPLD